MAMVNDDGAGYLSRPMESICTCAPPTIAQGGWNEKLGWVAPTILREG